MGSRRGRAGRARLTAAPAAALLPALVAVVAMVALVTLAGCSARAGQPESSSAWNERVDKTLGTALSSLGTTELVLENQRDDRLTRPYVVVAVRDATRLLDQETSAFLAAQPPADATADARRATRTLLDALATLQSATTAASGPDTAARELALAQVRREYDAVKKVQDDLAGGKP